MAEENPIQKSEKKSFGRDVSKLVTGTVIAQAVGICLSPVITRIFSPELYGIASVFTSLVSIIVVIACLRYEMAILLPKEDKEAGNVFLLCILILIFISALLIPIIYFFGDIIAGLLGNSAVADYLFLVPVAVFIDGLYLALRYWNTRRKRFGTQATTQALQSISGSGIKLGLGVGGVVTPGALISGHLLGNGIGTLILLWQAIRSDLITLKSSFKIQDIFSAMKRYKKFPLYNTWGAFLNTLSWQLPVLMITAFFSPAVAGLYALGMSMIQLPMSLVGSSISQVYLQRASLAVHNKTLHILTKDTAATLFMLSILPFGLLSIVGGDLFALVFGAEWLEAGLYVQILSIWAMMWFITSALAPTAVVLEKQEIHLVYNVILLVTRFLSLLIGGLCGSVYLALFLFAASGLVVYGGIGCLFIFVWSKVSLKELWFGIRKSLLISLTLLLGIFIISLISLPSILLCIVAILAGLFYLVYLFKKEPLIRSYLK